MSAGAPMTRSQRSYYFVRHGLPLSEDASFGLSGFERDMLGEVDASLSITGREQAARVVGFVRDAGAELIISSTRRRARETAQVIATGSGLPLGEAFAELDEIAPGRLPLGRPPLLRLLLSRRWPRALRRRVGHALRGALSLLYIVQWRRGRTTEGDEIDAARRRVQQLLARLDAMPERRIVVVGHAYWILLMALEAVAGGPRNLLRLGWVDNCSVTRVDSDGAGGYQLVYFARRAG